jgi:hypothetical protein
MVPSHLRAAVLALPFASLVACSSSGDACRARETIYNGWRCTELTNGRVDVVVAPDLGGRIIGLRLDGHEYLWMNRDLTGQVRPATPGGGLSGWANYGGDKLWPAPQGWSGPQEWPGPPDPADEGGCTDSGRFELEVTASGPDGVAVRLKGPRDLYAGIRFIREIRLDPRSTTVELVSVMENVVDHPVRWGIWQNTQHSAPPLAGAAGAPPRSDVAAWAPISSRSRYPGGYRVMFGPKDDPQFSVLEPPESAGRILRVDYAHRVGKVGIDAEKGWLAVTHEESGYLFAQTFEPDPGREHPDGASIEFWTSGPGRIALGDRQVDLGEDEPWLLESEVLSPYVRLEPGSKYAFPTRIHLGRGKGPVLAVKEAVAVLDPVHRGPKGIEGKLVVFHDGTLAVRDVSPGAPPAATLGGVRAGSLVDLQDPRWGEALAPLREGPQDADFQLALTLEKGG